ncbi:hypothetical protein Tco_1397780 [Tanacetum coccineum]
MAVNDGSQRWSTPPDHQSMAAVNDGQRWWTIGQPPLDHRWTTAGPPVNGGRPPVKAGQQLGRVEYWAVSGQVIGHGPGQVRVWSGSGSGPGRVDTWHHKSGPRVIRGKILTLGKPGVRTLDLSYKSTML